jgi:hypothetical protein
MRIFHYTSIEALAMILSNRTIRFSRLDTVDDPDEYSYRNTYGINPAQFIYVSCWSNNPNESIPQWKIYGNNQRGVRISLDHEMFHISYEDIDKGRIVPFLLDKQFNFDKDYIASLPYVNDHTEHEFFKAISCVANPKSEMEGEYIKIDRKTGTDLGKIGVCKSHDWHFLNEHRFRICVVPKKRYTDRVTPFDIAFRDNTPYKEKYVDLPVIDTVLENIEITLGPEVGVDGEVIVKALMKKYLGREDCRYSVFKGLL